MAVNDTGSTTRCADKTFNVLGNDYDPDGNTPLVLIDASYNRMLGSFTYDSAGTIGFYPYGDGTGPAAIVYTIRDSLGATASATLTVSVTAGANCGTLQAPPAGPDDGGN